MSEININVNEIDQSILRLQNLRSKCKSLYPQFPETVGGGNVVNELEHIAATYKTLYNDLETLISYTIQFLENVKKSYMSSDLKASNSIKGE